MANTNATPRLHFIPQPFWLNVTLNSSPLTTCNAHCEKGRVFHTTKFTISGTILQDHNLDSKTWDDLLCFYGTVIRPVLEYACPRLALSLKPRCHADKGTGVAAAQSTERSLCEDGDYTMSLIRAGLNTLESRREQLTKRFFNRSVISETSCLHYLLPDKCDVSVTGRFNHLND